MNYDSCVQLAADCYLHLAHFISSEMGVVLFFQKFLENISLTLPKVALPNGIEAKGVLSRLPRFGREVNRLLELTPSQKKTVRHQFDSYCRKVLREEARDYMRSLVRKGEREVALSELSEEQMVRLYVSDEYPSEQFHFDVQGYDIAVKDEKLAEALASLSDDKRDIILLAYFLDMTDQEIASKLNVVRRTVQYRRASSLKEMKQRMEVMEDGGQTD